MRRCGAAIASSSTHPLKVQLWAPLPPRRVQMWRLEKEREEVTAMEACLMVILQAMIKK
jgi:hypothetical protein